MIWYYGFRIWYQWKLKKILISLSIIYKKLTCYLKEIDAFYSKILMNDVMNIKFLKFSKKECISYGFPRMQQLRIANWILNWNIGSSSRELALNLSETVLDLVNSLETISKQSYHTFGLSPNSLYTISFYPLFNEYFYYYGFEWS